MGRNSKKEIPLWAKTGHQKPVTRREFLASGVIPFSASLIAPSIVTLLGKNAYAQQMCDSAGKEFIPFVTLNLSGGPSLAGQLALKNLSGGYLNSYTKIGLGSGPSKSFNIEKEFGTAEFAGTGIGGNVQGLVSKFLMGMRDPRQIQDGQIHNLALQKTAFVAQPVALADDTSSNPIDITGYVMKLGMQGQKLPNLGTADTSTGIAQRAAKIPPPAPFRVGSVTDILNALSYGSAFRTGSPNQLSKQQVSGLAKLISSLSFDQTRKIAAVPGGESFKQLIDCAGIKNVDLVTTGGGDVDAFSTTQNSKANELAAIWGVNIGARTGQDAIFGAMVYNALIGNAATVNLNMGGYDYHDGTRTTGDQRDLDAGIVVGKILQTAELYGKPLFLYVCADGAVSSPESATADSIWSSDRGIAGVQYMLMYNPAGRLAVTSNQIGGFNNGQVADGEFLTGNNPEAAAQAIFANYAAWNNEFKFLEDNRILGDAGSRAKVIKIPA